MRPTLKIPLHQHIDVQAFAHEVAGALGADVVDVPLQSDAGLQEC